MVKKEATEFSYLADRRQRGSGPVRIGERMKVREDLYSMLYVTTLHAEYIDYYDKEKDLNENATEKMLKKHRRSREKE